MGTAASGRARVMPDRHAFAEHIDFRGPDECWPWTGNVNKATGYGVFHPSRRAHPDQPRTVTAHRYAAWLAEKIELRDSRHVDHTCHNDTGCPPGPCPHRLCCNPRHLNPTSNRGNVNGSHNSNIRKTHCPKGHEYTDENTYRESHGRRCRQCARDRDRKRAPRGR